MALVKVADAVVSWESSNGSRIYRTVGALLQDTNNNPDKGPGYMLMLDRHLNLAALPEAGAGSVAISFYHNKNSRDGSPRQMKQDTSGYRPQASRSPADDDDIPF